MDNPKLWIFLALGVVAAGFLVALWRVLRAAPGPKAPTGTEAAIGFGTNFFDTLGIGSYAPTTVLFRFFRLVPDERIPGTMTIGHALPTITQAFIYISIVEVEMKTLILLILASIVGSWLGAGVVARWPRRKIQLGMGAALLAAAILFVIKNLDAMRGDPMIPGGTALGLDGVLLTVGLLGNFALGALMTLGIGLYAPCLIMISLLGMNPIAAFPIMMGSCAFLMPVASLRFIKANAFSVRPALGLALGGIPAVLIAAFIVKSLPLVAVRWLVVVVVLYAAVGLLRAARRPAAAVEIPPPVP
ncbi:MAG TPA: sulfite exporter TauE/SafE family protein [Gemmatimonadales bacterium]|jgi:uncharacterized membrane protein YfcA|nr:sulfite exporter TauE/SafE family protein [Gemmatimonadales bacterium]